MSSAPTSRQAASGSEYASIARTAMRCHLANTSSAVRKAPLSTGNTFDHEDVRQQEPELRDAHAGTEEPDLSRRRASRERITISGRRTARRSPRRQRTAVPP